MGIILDDFDVQMITHLAEMKEAGRPHEAYLFGLLGSSVDLFTAGHSEKSDLESMWASVKMLDQLWKLYSAEALREIACGTRDVPGEDA